MKTWKRLLPYLLLNAIVSATAMLTVLYFWNRAHPFPSVPQANPITASTHTAQTQPTATLPPLDTPLVTITAVIAPGDLTNEAVILKRIGEGELSLTGWQIVNVANETYTFPDLLFQAGEIYLYSQRNSTTNPTPAMTLYWERSTPAWSSGDLVRLLDPAGNVRATFRIP
jgi:hypothetical protein